LAVWPPEIRAANGGDLDQFGAHPSTPAH